MKRRLAGAIFSLSVAAGVLLGTGLIPEWGAWYSGHLAYRWQTEALLNGSMSLGTDPGRLASDLLWTKGNVQQPWGLGVPFWRLPFEGIARLFGQPAFPDRLAFGAALALLTFAVLWLFVISRGLKHLFARLLQRPEAASAFLLLVLFPPFLTVCRFRFIVYEEAAAYSYLAGVGLFVGTLLFSRKPTFPAYLVLGLLAGAAPFVRPTLLAYSAASALIAWLRTRHLGWPRWRSFLGAGVFGLGPALLFLSNVRRFGSGLEFGHSLNLNAVAPLEFATRFDYPFRTEPLTSAGAELMSSLFLAGSRFSRSWYESGLFPGQSATFRWREFYFTTYDLSYLLALMLVCAAGMFRLVRSCGRRQGRNRRGPWSETDVMIGWSLISLVPLFVFYLRTPIIASRYLLDFGPAIAVAMSALVFMAARYARARLRRSWRAAFFVYSLFALWWGWQMAHADGAAPADPVLTRNQLVAPVLTAASFANLADAAAAGMNHEGQGPPFNGSGLELETGRTKAEVTLFIPAIKRLALEISLLTGETLSHTDYERIRVKVGLEFLERRGIEKTPAGLRLIFDGPRRAIYQNGTQVCFLGFMSAEELNDGYSRFRLLEVNWEELEEAPREIPAQGRR